jgi:hypothetical protein
MEQAGPPTAGGINARDYRYVMSLARRYNAIVFWHRDRNGYDWQPLLMPLSGRGRDHGRATADDQPKP